MSGYLQEKIEEDPALAPLYRVMRDFEKAQSSYANQGACDTEPDWVWHYVLREAAHGRSYPDDAVTVGDWQLFSRVRGSGLAAARLTKVARDAHAAILKLMETLNDKGWRRVEVFLEDYCWRVGWD